MIQRGALGSATPKAYCPPIAVVDMRPSRIAFWHIDIGGEILPRTSRLTGAWVIDNTATDTLSTLLSDRRIAYCTPSLGNSIVE